MNKKSGVLVVDKPQGITTNKLIQQIKKTLNINKIGHAGTLDPLATGVVIVLVNTGTKLSDFLLNQEKEYIVTGKLYIETDSYDSDGNIINTDDNHLVTEQMIKDVLNKYNDYNYDQYPPIYSAIKVNGKKLYEYARDGKEVEIKPRNVTIKETEFISFDPITNEFTFRAKVSKGTYIRSLIVDIAKDLNTIAHITMLRRTQSGQFRIEDSTTIENVEIDNIIPMYDSVKTIGYQMIELDETLADDVLKGKKIILTSQKDDKVFLTYNNNVIALYHRENGDIFRSLKGGLSL